MPTTVVEYGVTLFKLFGPIWNMVGPEGPPTYNDDSAIDIYDMNVGDTIKWTADVEVPASRGCGHT